MNLSQELLDYYQALHFVSPLPRGVLVMNPYRDPAISALCKTFYNQYYSDDHPRALLLGINPGRFGGGATGIPFTDPVKLEAVCGIPNTLPKKSELSSDFIYRVANAFGGPVTFYRHFLIGSVCPLGFTKDGKNLNYYDDKRLRDGCTPFILKSLKALKEISKSSTVFCIGEGENFKILNRLSEEHALFERVHPLPHPRFIMQYRRKKVEEYVERYVSALDDVVHR